MDSQSLPSVQLFYEIKSKFDINDGEFKEIIADMLIARGKFEEIAKRNKINNDNLKMLRNNYDHEDFTKAKEFLAQIKQNIVEEYMLLDDEPDSYKFKL